MVDRLVALIVDESKWPAAAMFLALLSVVFMLVRHRYSTLPTRTRVLAAMNLFSGALILTMAFGHLLAVTTKLMLGTLEGPIPLLYLIGIALGVPSAWLIVHARRLFAGEERAPGTVVLNAWLIMTLLVLGLPNLALATTAFLTIAYQQHSRRAVGWAIVSVAALVNVGMLVAMLIFLASGQSFEQFSGMR